MMCLLRVDEDIESAVCSEIAAICGTTNKLFQQEMSPSLCYNKSYLKGLCMDYIFDCGCGRSWPGMSAATLQGEDPGVHIGNLCRSQIQKDACTERCLKYFQAVASTFICFQVEQTPLLNL